MDSALDAAAVGVVLIAIMPIIFSLGVTRGRHREMAEREERRRKNGLTYGDLPDIVKSPQGVGVID